jgi:spore maturation protein CgeB
MKIDIFMPPLSNYGVLHHFTEKMHEAMLRAGVTSRLLEAKRNDPGPFLQALFDDKPDCTLSFNGLLPDNQDRFFCDMVDIPHVACLVDSPNSFLALSKSPLTIITCVDRSSVDFFKGTGNQNVVFMPHGVDRSLSPDLSSNREYDVVMLSSCIDYEGIRSSWKNKYSVPLCKAMEEAAENALLDISKPYYQTFVDSLDKQVQLQSGIDPQTIDILEILFDIEMYIRGKDRVELVRSIKEAKVDVFGSADETAGWKKYVGDKRNVVVHDPVPFKQALAIMKHSKIVLNSCPWISYGGHERIFAGLASGALVLTNENDFLKEEFKDGESIAFYQHGRWDKANHRVNEYLEDVSKRNLVAKKGREIVMNRHTWDHRAAQLLRELPALLKKIEPARRNH